MDKINVILCDDHPMVLDGLEKMIRTAKDMIVVSSFNNAETLMNALPATPAILLLDLHLPDGDGMELCKRISKSHPHIAILGFSGVEDIAVITHFIKNGARGYLLKTSSGIEILEAIRTLAGGGEFLGSEITGLMIKKLSSSHESTGYIPKLSVREKEVLQLIVAENTTQEIAEKLFISVNTVETHRNHLLQKLGAKNLAGLVRIALEKGLA